jgi:hypothetical protein
MRVRIGVSLGPAAVPAVFADAVDHVEALGVDSLWLSEMVFGSLVEPFAGMAYDLPRAFRTAYLWVNSRCGLPFQIFLMDLLRSPVLKPGVPTL